jgi:hypothetical protein
MRCPAAVLRAYVLIDLKLDQLTHQDLGRRHPLHSTAPVNSRAA